MRAIVLGLGATQKFYNTNKCGEHFTIGVNDIWRTVKTDYVVCVDHEGRFTEDRLKVIKNCKPKVFFSSAKDWSDNVNFRFIKLLQPCGKIDLDSENIPFSNNSTFVACVIAYKLGAKEIIMYGMDMLGDHKYFSKSEARKKAIEHFTNLKLELIKKNVKLYVGNAASKLYPHIPLKKL